MWEADLKREGFDTVYFNAWENDFDNNPLVAIMAELETLTRGNDEKFKSLVRKAAILSKSILPALIKSLASKYIDTKELTDLLNDATTGAFDIMDEEIKAYTEKKKGLIDFRSELQAYLDEKSSQSPLVFIIDELDRCRPNYSVQVLEQIKHFFNVPGIVFVLSIDKKQLSSAIKGVYGSEQLNSDEYLRRFINLEFVMPEPESGDFTRYLYNYYSFDKYFRSKERAQNFHSQSEIDMFLNYSILLFENSNATLRQQEIIYAHTRIALNAFSPNNYIYPELLIFLVLTRTLHPDFYQKLVARKSTPQEILDDFKNIFPTSAILTNEKDFLFLEVNLIQCYNNYYREMQTNSVLVNTDSDGRNILMIKPISDRSEGGINFMNALDYLDRNQSRQIHLPLSHFLKKIDLTSNFVM